MVYVERTLSNGKVRHGVVGVLDLEDYDYKKGARSLIRATEGTVEERLPARIQIRDKAWLEDMTQKLDRKMRFAVGKAREVDYMPYSTADGQWKKRNRILLNLTLILHLKRKMK